MRSARPPFWLSKHLKRVSDFEWICKMWNLDCVHEWRSHSQSHSILLKREKEWKNSWKLICLAHRVTVNIKLLFTERFWGKQHEFDFLLCCSLFCTRSLLTTHCYLASVCVWCRTALWATQRHRTSVYVSKCKETFARDKLEWIVHGKKLELSYFTYL